MDVVRLAIPYQFAKDRVLLDWRTICFGLKNELLDPGAASEFAIDQVFGVERPRFELIELASGRGQGPTALRLVEQLAASESELEEAEDLVRDRWLYLALAWLYDRREHERDPLQRVEEVYADFGYPDRLVPFVRYMPMIGPDLGSVAANERRLFQRWKAFLDESAASLGPSRSSNPRSRR